MNYDQTSGISLCFTDLKWESRQDVKFNMAELHGLTCATILLILFYVKESLLQVQTISLCSPWYLAHSMLLLLLCVMPIHCENSWEICFSGGSRQTLQMRKTRQLSALCCSTTRKVHFTLVLLRAKSLQIGLNHSCYVFGSSSTLYYIVILAFTAFLV